MVEVQTVSQCPPGDELCEVRFFETEVIIVPVLLIAASCLVGGCILWMRCRNLKSLQTPGLVSEGWALSTARTALQVPDSSLGQWEVPRERIIGGMKLVARGRYGPIYQACLAPSGSEKERPIIVKELQDSPSPALAMQFVERIRFQSNIGKHPNLATMMGCCTKQEPICLLVESLGLGDLLGFLWLCRKEYLHTKGLVHGYVSARNVLLAQDLTVRLGSLHIPFQMQDCRRILPRDMAPQKWQAPENLMKRPLSPKSDVWSFGILLYEMITLGAPPYGELSPSGVLQYLQRGHRMSQPANCRSFLYRLMKQCWEWRGDLRPSVPDLRKKIGEGMKGADDRTVIRIPHRIDPEAYAVVTGTFRDSWPQDYTIL
ncbi:tyrosine-protein kinase STYK1-like isoform X2 [Narcine bancroftii]|uniref:tyrosine-protein kinase STYK1-like isoform X2 n=1 Tax=Narcine bancroftii TaxID=1343680 RepID=UPI0038314DDF